MAGSTIGIILGPLLGGWLYELGGIRLPFLVVAALAVLDLVVFAADAGTARAKMPAASMEGAHCSHSHRRTADRRRGGCRRHARPVLPLVFSRVLARPGLVGSLFGMAAVVERHASFLWAVERSVGRRRLMISWSASLTAHDEWLKPLMAMMIDVDGIRRSCAFAGVFARLSDAGVKPTASCKRLQRGVGGGLDGGPSLGGFLLERAGFAAHDWLERPAAGDQLRSGGCADCRRVHTAAHFSNTDRSATGFVISCR